VSSSGEEFIPIFEDEYIAIAPELDIVRSKFYVAKYINKLKFKYTMTVFLVRITSSIKAVSYQVMQNRVHK